MIPKVMFDYITDHYGMDHHPGWADQIVAMNVDDFYVKRTLAWDWSVETVSNTRTRFYLLVNFYTEQEAVDALEWIKTLDQVLFI